MWHPNDNRIKNFLLDMHGVALHLPITACAARYDILRQQTFYFSGFANGSKFLIMALGFGEHAQINKGPCAVFEIENDIGIVENVWHGAIIVFIEMVDIAAR